MTQDEKDEIAIWRGRIKLGQTRRDKEHSDVWEANLKAYRGQLKPPDNVWAPSDPWVSIELVHSSVRSSVPTLLYNNPRWTVTPKRPVKDPDSGEDVSWDNAEILSAWLDQVWQETDGNEHVRLAIISAFLALGVVKVGYAPVFADDEFRGEYEYDESTGDVKIDYIDPSTGNPVPVLKKGQYLYKKDEDGEDTDELIWDDVTALPVLHPGTLMREEFFCEWVPWTNILFDPEGGNVFRNHRYVIEEWTRPEKEVQEDPRYLPWRRKIRGTAKLDTDRVAGQPLYGTLETDDTALKAHDKDCKRVRGWDIYDFVEDRLKVVVDGDENDRYLMNIPTPDGIEHGPFVFLKFNEDPGEMYQRTDVEAMSKVELEYNITRSQMLTHRNQSRSRYFEVLNAGFTGADGGEAQRTLFQSGPSGTICQVKSAEGIVPARKDSIDQSFFQAVPNIRMDFAEVAGQGGEARGVADADTATQASLVAASADVRQNDRRDNLVQKFLSRIGRKLIQAAQANADCIPWVKITGDPNTKRPFSFREVNPANLAGEFETDVAMGSTQPKNSTSRVTMYTQIITMLAQNPMIAAAPTLMRRLFEAIDLKDEQLIAELEALGKAAVQAAAPPAQDGGVVPQAQQTMGDIGNQFLRAHNVTAGMPTGAPVG